MAKRKTIPYVLICSKTGKINGSGRATKEKVKEMERMRYCHELQERTMHKAKPVKKGGTKALANAK